MGRGPPTHTQPRSIPAQPRTQPRFSIATLSNIMKVPGLQKDPRMQEKRVMLVQDAMAQHIMATKPVSAEQISNSRGGSKQIDDAHLPSFVDPTVLKLRVELIQ